MLEAETIVKPASRIRHRELKDESEVFSGVYLEIKGKDVEINVEGIAKEATVEVGLSPTLTRSIEVKARVGDKTATICLTNEIVEMVEEALRGLSMGLDKHIGIDKVLKKLKKQKVIISVAISPDRILLLDELVEKKVFRNRSEAVVAAIDDLPESTFSGIL